MGGVSEGVIDDAQDERELKALGEVGVGFKAFEDAAIFFGVEAAEDVEGEEACGFVGVGSGGSVKIDLAFGRAGGEFHGDAVAAGEVHGEGIVGSFGGELGEGGEEGFVIFRSGRGVIFAEVAGFGNGMGGHLRVGVRAFANVGDEKLHEGPFLSPRPFGGSVWVRGSIPGRTVYFAAAAAARAMTFS